MKLGLKIKLAASAIALLALQAPATWVAPAYADAMVQSLPNVADLAEKLLPAVVEISVQSKSPDAAGDPQVPENSPFKDFFDEFLKKRREQGQGDSTAPKDNVPQPDDNNLVNSLGSGFIVDAKGLIVTNNHVVADGVNYQVHLQDGTLLKAELVGHDPKTDIAVLRVKPEKDLPVVTFGDSDKVRVGEWVLAIGNPFGLGGSVSLGIISARNRDINAGPYDDYFQTDAAINKGNSGGPLFNLEGNVVGINTAIFSPTGGSVGIGFSVPANTARSVVDQLVKFGQTRRGWLGVKLQTLTPDIAEAKGLTKPRGALIADVTEGGPSSRAGIKTGDIIVGFNGRAIDDSKILPRIVAQTEVGKDTDVTVLRDGKEIVLRVTLGRLEEGEKLVAQQEKEKKKPEVSVTTSLGMTLSDLNDETRLKYKISDKVKGAVVTEVAKDSVAVDKGIQAGDVIVEAGGKPVTSASDIVDAVDAATKDGKSSILVLVAKAGDGNETRFVPLKLKK